MSDSAALIAMRRCEPLSRPFVYHELSARTLLITQRSWPRAGAVASAWPGAMWRNPSASLVALAKQHLDVIEQETSAIFQRDLRDRLSARERRGLLKDPGVAQGAATDEHAGNAAGREPFNQLRGSMQSPLPKTGIRTPSATRPMSVQSENPDVACAAVRP